MSHPLSEPAARIARIVLMAATVSAVAKGAYTFIATPLLHRFTGEFEDFNAYYGAAQAVAHGVSPYAGFDSSPANMTMSGFIYPPFAAWLLEPIGALPQQTAAMVWLWAMLACTLAAAILTAKVVLPATWPRIQLALVATFVYPPATYNLWHGQMNPLIFLILAVALWAYVNDRELVCGVALGLGAGIKVAPIVLGLLLLRRRWWRGVAAMGVTGLLWLGAGIAVLGTGVLREFMSTVLPALERENGWLYNQSWGGVVNRAANHSILTFDPPSVPIELATAALAIGSLALAMWAVRDGPRTAVERAGEFGTGVAAMLLSATIAWYPHETHLLIPMAAAAALTAQRSGPDRRWLIASLATAAILIAVVAPVLIAGVTPGSLQTLRAGSSWFPYLQLWSLPAVGTAILMVALALTTHRTHTPPGYGPMTTVATPE